MVPEPLISVLLANWNGARFLNEAIASVVHQTCENWELIVVDTGSEDDSPALIRRWAARDSRIRPIFKPQNMVCPLALNLGLGEARGAYVARIESDDLWRPDRLAAQIDFLEAAANERIGVVGCDAALIDESGRALGVKCYPRGPAECLRAIWYRNPFCHSAVLIRRAALRQCGGYDPAFTLVEDLDLWYRLGRSWQLANLRLPLVSYRVWRGSLTSRKLRALAWRAHQVRHHAARRLGYKAPFWATTYSFATLPASLLPPLLIRSVFEQAIRWLGPGAALRQPATAAIIHGAACVVREETLK